MTKLEAVNKIRVLPTLKDGYVYDIGWSGSITICYENTPPQLGRLLYRNFEEFAEGKYWEDVKEYESYFVKPIVKEIAVKDVISKIIVGYE